MLRGLVTYTYVGSNTRGGNPVEQLNLRFGDIYAGAGVPDGMKVKAQEVVGTVYFDNAVGRLVEMKQVLRVEQEGSIGGRMVTESLLGTMSWTLQPK